MYSITSSEALIEKAQACESLKEQNVILQAQLEAMQLENTELTGPFNQTVKLWKEKSINVKSDVLSFSFL